MSLTSAYRASVLLLLAGCVTESELNAALDRDRDGFLPVQAGGDDCDETRASVNPAADEICGDGVDNDCDGVPDDDGVGARTFFQDADGDGFGVEDETVSACTRPEGFAEFIGDCDDTDPSFNPAVQDLCDGLDQDCDGLADDDDVLETRYFDNDLDGFGTEESAVLTCQNDAQLVAQTGDCDDEDPSISPAATDVCDGIDQDCDGVVDDDAVSFTQYRDDDGDGWGLESDADVFCELLPGYAPLPGDCDDSNAGISPEALDLCDGIDQNCDGFVDEDAIELVYYFDGDGDGAGSDTNAVASCEPLSGYVLQGGDCDDSDGAISPLATDVCDGIDQNCNGAIDDDALVTLYFEDLDEDGRGNEDVSVEACTPPDGFVLLAGDCDDTDGSVRPGVSDQCDGVDQDCDGLTDEDTPLLEYFPDSDGDGAGTDVGSQLSCTPLTNHALVGGDCDDGDASISPLLDDVCDGVDQNCNGIADEDALVFLWFEDADGDGSGNGAVTEEACAQPTDFVQASGDCDDTDASIRPGASDLCDGVDQDCDGQADEDASFATFYPDQDRDGVGNSAGEILICDTPPANYVPDAGDCDDTDQTVVVPTWYLDEDTDGFGTTDTLQQCTQPAGYAAETGDCDDQDESRNPGFVEVCRTRLDEDCDSTTDCLPGPVVDLATAPAEEVSRYPLFDLPTGETTTGVFTTGNIVGGTGSADDFVITTTLGQFFVVSGDTLDFENPFGPYTTDCETFYSMDFTSSALDDLICDTGSGTIQTWRGAMYGVVPHSTITDVSGTDRPVLVESSIHGAGMLLREDSGGEDIVFVPLQAGSGDSSSLSVMRYEHDPDDGGIIAGAPCLDAGQDTTCAVIWGFTSMLYVGPNHTGLSTSTATVLSYDSAPPAGFTLPFTIFPNVASIGDFDSNGVDEISFSDLVQETTLYAPGPAQASTGFVDATGEALGSADFDGDGADDVVLLAGVQGLMGFSTKADTGSTGGTYDTVVVGLRELDNQVFHGTKDIDGDGFEDIVTLSFAEVRILWGTGI